MKYNTIATIAALSTPSLVQAASGTLNVLTMNVDDTNVPGDKTANAQRIGSLFSELNYDVINVQSDFKSHAALYGADNHPYRTLTSGDRGKGDGLNTLSKFPFVDFRRIPWNVCSNAEGGDCDTPKGFTFMRARITEGVYIDMYNLQTDFGMKGDDVAARSANLAQISEYIETWSTGNAVMVFGDTNSIFSRTADNINVFGNENGMSDAWYTLVRQGNAAADITCSNPSDTLMCELGDKVLSRNSELLSLNAATFEYVGDKFLQPNGSMLSDRDPVQVSLSWSQSETLRQSDLYGAPHGLEWFNDAVEVASKPGRPKVATIGFSGGNRVDKVSVTLNDNTKFSHGGLGGDWKDINLEVDEYWKTVYMCQGMKDGNTRIFYIKATTTKNNILEVGKTTDVCETYNAPAGFQIIGFAGQSGDEIDQLGVIYALQ
ncbi:hypothetical protein CFO_g708 [Ceratocystis platani]|uniref:Jacalin-type lectin domain-containing protein n=1 Tax=Ceratocystis fimbriata f. sp. platani TaxID=88771 RepID=A0A0F8DM46_CERFI|nr:hypothetical protein CFO_g708 [Ceratocystis platani]